MLGAPVTRVALAETHPQSGFVAALTQPARTTNQARLGCALVVRAGSAGPRCARFGIASGGQTGFRVQGSFRVQVFLRGFRL